MEIVAGRMQLFATEEEADILLQAVGRYIEQGPYWPPQNYSGLTAEEHQYEIRRKALAEAMYRTLQQEMLRRYHEAEEAKLRQ